MNIESPICPGRGRLRHQCIAPVFWNQGEDGIIAIRGVVREVNTRSKAPEDAAGKKRDVQVRRLQPAVVAGDAARLDRIENAGSLGVCCEPAKAGAMRIDLARESWKRSRDMEMLAGSGVGSIWNHFHRLYI